jgi:TrmH family RNA methyltransferase
LENLQDPGNLGTIIRTAAATDCHTILLSPGCVDPYNPKVVRATMGAILAVDIFTDTDLPVKISELTAAGYQVLGTDLSASASLFESQLDIKTAWLIGNESQGLSKSLRTLCTTVLKIPMTDKAESLNAAVAASLCLYEYRRQIG